MGIEGLLQFIKPSIKSDHISIFKEKTAAIDGMSWLYRGCYSCAYELNQGIETKQYLFYLQKMIQLLQFYKIKPIIVLDGKNLTPKEKTENNRQEMKQKNKELGEKFMKENNTTEAKKYFSRSITITKEMIYLTIDVLKQQNIDVVVAPYEADAQISYMVKNGYADFAITEDSDLICYNCPLIMFKLKSDGFCEIFEYQKIKDSVELRKDLNDNLKSFMSFSQEQVIEACIMAGCDYLPSIKSIGIRKAVDYIYRFVDINKAVSHMKQEKSLMSKIPADYEVTVLKIKNIFLYQRVFDMKTKKMATSMILPKNSAISSQLIGKEIKNAEKFSKGELDFETLEQRQIKEIDFKSLFKNSQKKVITEQKDLQNQNYQNYQKKPIQNNKKDLRAFQSEQQQLKNFQFTKKQNNAYPQILINNNAFNPQIENPGDIKGSQQAFEGTQPEQHFSDFYLEDFELEIIEKDLPEQNEKESFFVPKANNSEQKTEDDFDYLFKLCQDFKDDDYSDEVKSQEPKYHQPIIQKLNQNQSPLIPPNPFAKKDADKVRDSLFQIDNSSLREKLVKNSPIKYQNAFSFQTQKPSHNSTIDQFFKQSAGKEQTEEKQDKKRIKKSDQVVGQTNLFNYFVKK